MQSVLMIIFLLSCTIFYPLVAQPVYNPANGHSYETTDTPMIWEHARIFCESRGGYLATMTMQAENDWIWNNLRPLDYFFGATDAEEEGTWKWVTGEAWEYTNWAPGEPNNKGGNGEPEHVVVWWTPDGRWNDVPGTDTRRFVCEYDHLTGAENREIMPLPREFTLTQNYPNPFNPETVIQYQLPKQTEVRLEIYNLLGELVKTLVNEKQSARDYAVTWNGKDGHGRQVASGVYLYRLTAGEFVQVRKMILVR